MEEAVTRFLPVHLGKQELEAKSQELANAITELEELKVEYERIKSTMNGQIKEKEKEYKRLAIVVRDKIENREVECFTRRSERNLTIEVVRADTYEVVQTRPMTESERQLVMFPTRGEINHDTKVELPIPTVGEKFGLEYGTQESDENEDPPEELSE